MKEIFRDKKYGSQTSNTGDNSLVEKIVYDQQGVAKGKLIREGVVSIPPTPDVFEQTPSVSGNKEMTLTVGSEYQKQQKKEQECIMQKKGEWQKFESLRIQEEEKNQGQISWWRTIIDRIKHR